MIEQAAQVEYIEQEPQALQPLPEYASNGKLIGPKYEAFAVLTENGLTKENAAQALGYNKKYGYRIAKQYDLTSRKYIKLASEATKNILSGQPWGAIKDIKGSTALAAAQMVYDRVQPAIKQVQSLNVNLDINAVDYSRYMGDFTNDTP